MIPFHSRRLLLLVPILASGLACPQPVTTPPDLSKVVALGRLEPASGLLNVGAPPGDRIDALDGELEKTYVSAGEKMGQLASHRDRENEWQVAVVQLKEANERKSLIDSQGKAQIAEIEKRLALLRKQQAPDLQSLQDVVDTIKKRKGDAERLVADLQGTVARPTLEQQRGVVAGLEVELATAILKHKQAEAAYEMNIAAAEGQLDTARKTLASSLAAVPIQSLEQAEKAAKDRIRHSQILSPGSGQILRLLARPGDTVGTTPILRFGDTSKMVAVAEVYETDVNRIKIDDRAQVVFQDVTPGGIATGRVELHGKVRSIGRLVSLGTALDLNPAANADRRIIDVRIELDEADNARAAKFVNRQVSITIDAGKP